MDKNNDMKSSTSTAGGVGFCGLLTIVFIVLKLTGVIDWSWLWVLAPIWIPTAIAVIVLLIFLAIVIYAAVKTETEHPKGLLNRRNRRPGGEGRD